jgi:hypothetical protein
MHSKLTTKTWGTWIAALGSTMIISAAHAGTLNTDARYFTIDKVETHEVLSTEVQPDETALAPSTSTDLMSQDTMNLTIAGVDIGDIMNIGKQIWDIIAANKPVANVSTNSASAIPKGVTDWETLAGWQMPQLKTYETQFSNPFGEKVITFQYRVGYTPGGTYQGQGQYLANVTVTPVNVNVAWGYAFNAQVSIPSITNAGTTTSPIAAAQILVSWTVDTIVMHTQQSAQYYVRGDGQFASMQ